MNCQKSLVMAIQRIKTNVLIHYHSDTEMALWCILLYKMFKYP